MKSDLEQAKTLLEENSYTYVLCKDGQTYTSIERGVKPLLKWIESGQDFKDFSAADKIVGKAAALLYVLLGVYTVFAEVMSEDGIYTLARHGITPLCDASVKEIRNRTNTGVCLMEEAVKGIVKPLDGFSAIRNKITVMKLFK